jgi:hypothetical protein
VRTHRSAPNPPASSSSRRWGVVAAALVAGLAAAPATADSPATEPRPVACSWEPAADVLGFGPELAGTVRMIGNEVEVLHRVRCTDRPEGWLWMPASYQGSS